MTELTAERRNELLLEAVIEWLKRRSLEDLVDFYVVEGDEKAVDCLQEYEEKVKQIAMEIEEEIAKRVDRIVRG
ncbi:hypothetical protein DRN50_04540 [Thermococci archaeon]|nr:MAG: hypothetical protein DRN50_04540 [Thermococci archaeon]